LKLAIIIGSTRPGRMTERLAKWVVSEAKNLPGIEVDVIDLEDFDMPLFNEPVSPRFNPDRNPDGSVKAFLARLDLAEALIIVTPEYNHAPPGVLKNAIDYVDWQLSKKPIAFVGQGTVGGARAIEQLKLIVSEAKGLPIPESVTFMKLRDSISEDGVLDDEIKNQQYGPLTALQNLLKELNWYANALTSARLNK
jgi:NAD(P)H-dependent FMN reductase